MKALKWFLIIIGTLLVLGFCSFKWMEHQTKKASPEATVNYVKDDLKIDITYCRPFKKGRVIFGGLVPYDVVWRTGANEPTTFTTNEELTVGGKVLPAGKYTLWTLPHADNWEVFFNKKMYNWGINMDGVASRDPAEDVMAVSVPVEALPEELEQFTISVEDAKVPTLVFTWDKTRVSVPLQ
ncbi:MAG: DUF2911 domain-containing protein [Flavobacteriales bacterium]|jgi:hypothetical protein|nr:DUF2911 domain-containing protein [Flavobacteriales bacterium]MBK6893569.1 DUF2911 domain-containing protein [Flavobacteriales bacterium]MBK7248731.1 DUF2911 domain-containing protein [Flavobacteriales bacterium]MBK7287622.1 DUF2911 domain-containing protein [Flavobacteriales bacterium]MBK9059043.1 DUF2911 domain-containing protein [Flavobacteriales bacterium]